LQYCSRVRAQHLSTAKHIHSHLVPCSWQNGAVQKQDLARNPYWGSFGFSERSSLWAITIKKVSNIGEKTACCSRTPFIAWPGTAARIVHGACAIPNTPSLSAVPSAIPPQKKLFHRKKVRDRSNPCLRAYQSERY
jgi:hypothetical protein